jgi:hypothetical protein
MKLDGWEIEKGYGGGTHELYASSKRWTMPRVRDPCYAQGDRILLIVAGIGGLLLPGLVGTPFLIAGGVVPGQGPSGGGDLVQKRFPGCTTRRASNETF